MLITLALIAIAVLFIIAAIFGPDSVGLHFLPPAAFAVCATVFSAGAVLFTGWTMLKFLPTRNDRIVIGLRKVVREQIEPLEARVAQLDDEALRAKTTEFKRRFSDGESLASIRPEAYACVREASKRARAHRQYECQLIGGNVIENNSVAEMRTGEGKTIVCYMANYMKAIQGLKVHMVTVNDYLVKRDAEFCKPIFDLLDVSVGYITSDMPPVGPGVEVRRAAYACDITYGTNSEFGFDYLRDNMKIYRREQMQGKQDFAVVDEVDSILIDEARTPLIISGPAHDDVSNYRRADNIARILVKKQQDANRDMAARIDQVERTAPKDVQQNPKFKDGIKKFRTDPFWLSSDEAEAIGHMQYFVVEMDSKRANMTEHGAKLAQQELGIGTFYDSKNMNWPHYLDNSLRAHQTYVRDKEYVVQEGQVIIVDEFTGRLMHGRQWSDGLHQAVEAKEGVQIKQETQTLATITLQNLFKMYKHLAGMTGTAMTEAEEFMKIYKLDVVAIPTNKPIRRLDYNDKIYKTIDNKFDAIVEEIRSYSQEGHPADPWSLHDMLKQADRELAKLESSDTDVDKAAIAEQRATISKALAEFNDGKGPEEALARAYGDILPVELQGRPVLVGTASVESSERLCQLLTRKYGIEHEVLNAKNHAREAEIVAKAGRQQEMVRGKKKSICGAVTIATNMAGRGTDIVLGPGVAKLGGLHVVGTERHESRRIDNQLRGRCGRQGDPGSSRFFLSMDDPLLRLFMGEWVLKMLNMLGFEEGMAIEDKRLNRGIENAQKKVEERNFAQRKNLLEYDEVMDHQRKTFYTTRQKVVEGRGLSEMIWKMIDESVADAIDRYYDPLYPARCVEEWVAQHLGVHIDPDKLDISDFNNLTAEVREMAQYELRSSVQRTFGEYIDTDIGPDEWDVRGFQAWAEQYGVNFTQNQVKSSDPYELLEKVLDGASKTIENTDLTPLQQYIDPLYAKARLVRWAREKFDVDMTVDDLRQATHDEAEEIIRDKMREVYRRREIEYPVDAILSFAMQRGGQNRNEVCTIIANWANRKFGTNWTYEHLTGKEPKEIFAELTALNKEAQVHGYFDKEIDKAIAEHPGAELEEWAKSRFGEILDSHPLTSDDSEVEVDVRESLRACYREMLRYELSYIERLVLINTLDAVWKDNMYSMDLLRHSIGLRGYAEKDPKIEYKREGTRIFNEMLSNIRERVTDLIFKVQMSPGPGGGGAAGGGTPARPGPSDEGGGGMAYQNTSTQHADATGSAYASADQDRAAAQRPQGEAAKPQTIKRDEPKVGRNDPCPCGSGKKFKQCHGKAV
ncbi:MAG: preprotein translocase subunit SecA [Phycisphaerae bacterium]